MNDTLSAVDMAGKGFLIRIALANSRSVVISLQTEKTKRTWLDKFRQCGITVTVDVSE